MKEKILTALKNKFKNLGFGDKAFDGVADYLSKTVTEESGIETAIAGVEPLLKSFQGDNDKIRSEKAALEKKLNELEKKNDPNDPEPVKLEDDAPAWAKALLKQNEELAAKVTNFEKKGVAESLISRVQKNLTDKKIPASFLKGRTIEIENEDQIETVTKQLESDYAEIKQEMVNTGTVVDVPVNSVGSPAGVDADIEEWAEKTNPKKD